VTLAPLVNSRYHDAEMSFSVPRPNRPNSLDNPPIEAQNPTRLVGYTTGQFLIAELLREQSRR
jgi:hypothetical protein